MNVENVTGSEVTQRAGAERGAEPSRPESGRSESESRPAPSSGPSDPPAFRTWHPDTCDERRLRRGAR